MSQCSWEIDAKSVSKLPLQGVAYPNATHGTVATGLGTLTGSNPATGIVGQATTIGTHITGQLFIQPTCTV